MAGTIPLSMTQQFDVYGKPLAGGQLFIIQAGTVSTPQNAFQDINLTIPLPYPMTLDRAGRIPQFFLADGSVKVRLQDVTGVVQLASDNVLVIGPSSSGGGPGPTVDPTTLIQTGNMILRYGTGAFAGYVRMNGLSIGSATSGATERANLDCQNCFQFLWGVDPNLPMYSGGVIVARQTTAALDWAASRAIGLPDWRGYGVGGLDGMGNALAGRLTSAFYGGSPDLLGSSGGGESFLLTASNIPQITADGGGSVSVKSARYLIGTATPTVLQDFNPQTAAGFRAPNNTASISQETSTGSTSVAVTSNNTGGLAHRTIGPRKLCTIYLKL